MLKILRKITVAIECTEGKEVDRYICNKCGRVVREVNINGKKYTRKKSVYSKVIFIEKCNECKKKL
ncbi:MULTISPECIES: hypothetical protein [Clostridium]|uniref:hypothetical protein n=1 Tax=Clostridium TaxID=1485 RepID=UPI00232CA3CA|nr:MULTISPECIES: hypothetical protein [Clostridium]MDB2104848.1 hypothetical protein [Clostridium paraputrificum]MDU2108686.1 hypothetical protein [Clostridium sp.]MDU3355203.1 hypothetical protein [Clostridium sp.]MDU4727939.1 hypothetical protein [Clostridium sp.]